MVELVAAGIAGSCESCGALLSTDTRFCPACGAAAKPGLEAQRGPGRPGAGRAPRRGDRPRSTRSGRTREPEGNGEEPEPVFAEEAEVEDHAEQDTFDEEPELAEAVEPEPRAGAGA